ncbi:MAG: hypothetical protein CMI30_12940 [Opitutae bacterium]|nr:hypothetical protein [Opitutae bacterium]
MPEIFFSLPGTWHSGWRGLSFSLHPLLLKQHLSSFHDSILSLITAKYCEHDNSKGKKTH